MNWIAKHWLTLFVVFAIGYIASEPLRPYPVHYLVKAIPIFILAVFAYKNLSGRLGKTTLTALLFSAGGDIMLSMTFPNQFIAGLSSFLAAQLVYAILFVQYRNDDKQNIKVVISIGVVSYALVMLAFVLPDEQPLKTAVLAYLVVITSMALTATWAWRHSPLYMLGAFTFVVSDSLIAWNMFVAPVPASSLLIMGTYYAAQLMLVMGISTLNRPTEARQTSA